MRVRVLILSFLLVVTTCSRSCFSFSMCMYCKTALWSLYDHSMIMFKLVFLVVPWAWSWILNVYYKTALWSTGSHKELPVLRSNQINIQLRHYETRQRPFVCPVIVPPYKDPRSQRHNRVRHHDDEVELSETSSENNNFKKGVSEYKIRTRRKESQNTRSFLH